MDYTLKLDGFGSNVKYESVSDSWNVWAQTHMANIHISSSIPLVENKDGKQNREGILWKQMVFFLMFLVCSCTCKV